MIVLGRHCSLKWDTTGITVAGVTGVHGNSSNEFWAPHDLSFDLDNAMYVVDYSNNRIQKWSEGASFGLTVAGRIDGLWGSGANEFDYPTGVVLDSCANLIISDYTNNRIQSWPFGAVSGTTIVGGSKEL